FRATLGCALLRLPHSTEFYCISRLPKRQLARGAFCHAQDRGESLWHPRKLGRAGRRKPEMSTARRSHNHRRLFAPRNEPERLASSAEIIRPPIRPSVVGPAQARRAQGDISQSWLKAPGDTPTFS